MNPNKPFQVGDKVKIIANTNDSRNKVGDIGIISSIGSSDMNVDVKGELEQNKDGSWNYGNYTNFDEVRHLTRWEKFIEWINR